MDLYYMSNFEKIVGGYPGAMTIDVDHPIHKVQIFYGDVVRAPSL
jgi:hypothetical protein